MTFKKLSSLLLLLTIFFTFSSCTFIRMGEEGMEKIKTSSSHGYPNGIKPDEIRNIKDYIVNENDFVIIAESPYKTLYKTRNKSNMGRMSVLDDLMDYCVDQGGKYKFGKQFGGSIASEYESMDFEFSSVKDEYRKNRLRGYKGWMKCRGGKDEFEVNRKRRSAYFQITHKQVQLQGYALQWYIDYHDIKEMDLKELNIGLWSYSTLVQMGGSLSIQSG